MQGETRNIGGSAALVGLLLLALVRGSLVHSDDLAGTGNTAVGNLLYAPFATANLNPFVHVYNPLRAHTAKLPSKGMWQARLHGEVASHFTERTVSGPDQPESIFIDGESHRLNLEFNYAFSDVMTWSFSLPYITHERGGLDNAIDSWHQFWGLPDGGRPQFPEDQLRFNHQSGSVNPTELNDSVDGLGDLRLTMAYQIARQHSRYWSLRASLKLPTGDSDKFTGSGSRDLTLALAFSEYNLLASGRWQLHASAGLTRLGNSNLLNSQRRDWVGFASSTVSWRLRPNVVLKLQIDAHSAYYRSKLKELGEPSAQLVVGATIALADNWSVDVALSEDIIVDTAPDAVFIVGLNRQF